MKENLIGAAVTLALGLLIAYLGYRVCAYVIKKRPEFYVYASIFRQALQILYFVAVYFWGDKTGADVVYLLVGAAVGITAPMLFLTGRLVKLNDELSQKRKESEGDG